MGEGGGQGDEEKRSMMTTIRESSIDNKDWKSTFPDQGRRLPTPIDGSSKGINKNRPLPSPSSSFFNSSQYQHQHQHQEQSTRFEILERRVTNVLPYPYTMISSIPIPPSTHHSNTSISTVISPNSSFMIGSGSGSSGNNRNLPKVSHRLPQLGTGTGTGTGTGVQVPVGRRPLPKPLSNRHSLTSFQTSRATGIPSYSSSSQEFTRQSQDGFETINSVRSINQGITSSRYRVDEHGMILSNGPMGIGNVGVKSAGGNGGGNRDDDGDGDGDGDGKRGLPEPTIGLTIMRNLDSGCGMRPGDVGSNSTTPMTGGGDNEVIEEKVNIPTFTLLENDISAQGTQIIPQIQGRDEDNSAIPIIVFPDDDGGPIFTVDPPARTPSPSFTLSTAPAIQVSTDDGRKGIIAVPSINVFKDPGPPDIPTINFPIEGNLHSPLTTTTTHQGPGIFCASCDDTIIGRIVSAMSKRWHPECFKCETCKMLLEHVSSYEHEGNPYCHMDYHDVSVIKVLAAKK